MSKLESDFPFCTVRELRVLRMIYKAGGVIRTNLLRDTRHKLTERVWWSLLKSSHVEADCITDDDGPHPALRITVSGEILIDTADRIILWRRGRTPLLPKELADAMAFLVPQKKRRGRQAA